MIDAPSRPGGRAAAVLPSRALPSCALLSLAVALGCGEGEGIVRVTAYGEPFIEEGIPADAMDDGWAVAFDRFGVALADVRVAGVAIAVPPEVDVARASDGAGHELGSARVAGGDHGGGRFTLERIEVTGSATRGSDQKRFTWLFDAPTAYDRCQTITPVPDDGVGTFQITLHADHLFYDSLVAEAPRVLFQALADADENADGDITPAELGARGIGAYDAGSEGGVDDLWAWLVAAARTIGHVDGEGHCDARPLTTD